MCGEESGKSLDEDDAHVDEQLSPAKLEMTFHLEKSETSRQQQEQLDAIHRAS